MTSEHLETRSSAGSRALHDALLAFAVAVIFVIPGALGVAVLV